MNYECATELGGLSAHISLLSKNLQVLYIPQAFFDATSFEERSSIRHSQEMTVAKKTT